MNDSTVQPSTPGVAKAFATAFGLGYLPIASGTWGSLGGVVLVLALEPVLVRLGGSLPVGLGPYSFFLGLLVVNLLVAGIGVWSATVMARHWRAKDPGAIVIDEVSGQLIACMTLVPLGWKHLAAAFLLFRLFDIWKPFPARQAEALREGWGIMADDWIAGGYAAAALLVLRWAGF